MADNQEEDTHKELVKQINTIIKTASRAPNILSDSIGGSEKGWFSKSLGWMSDSFNIFKSRWNQDIQGLSSLVYNANKICEDYSPAYQYVNQIKSNLWGSIVGESELYADEPPTSQDKLLWEYIKDREKLANFITSKSTWQALDQEGFEDLKELVDTLRERGAISQLKQQVPNEYSKTVLTALENKQITDELFSKTLPYITAGMADNKNSMEKVNELATNSVLGKPAIDISMQESEFKGHDIKKFSPEQFDKFAWIFSSHLSDKYDTVNDKSKTVNSLLEKHKDYAKEAPSEYRQLSYFLGGFLDRAYESENTAYSYLYTDFHNLPSKAKAILENVMNEQYTTFPGERVSQFKREFRSRLGDIGPNVVNNLNKEQLDHISFGGNKLTEEQLDKTVEACDYSVRDEVRIVLSSINKSLNGEDKFVKYQELSAQGKNEMHKSLNNLPPETKHSMYWGIKAYNDELRANIFPFSSSLLNNVFEGDSPERFQNLAEAIKQDEALKDSLGKTIKPFTDLAPRSDSKAIIDEVLTPNSKGDFGKLAKISETYKHLASQRYIRAAQGLYDMTSPREELDNQTAPNNKIKSFSREDIFGDLVGVLNSTLKDPLLNFSISDGTIRAGMPLIQNSEKALELEDKFLDCSKGYMDLTPEAFSIEDRKYLADKFLEFSGEQNLSEYLKKTPSKEEPTLHQALKGDITSALARSELSVLNNKQGEVFSTPFLSDLSSAGIDVVGNSLSRNKATLQTLSDDIYNYYNFEHQSDSLVNPNAEQIVKNGTRLLSGGNTTAFANVFKEHEKEGRELLNNTAKSLKIDGFGVNGDLIYNTLTQQPKAIERACEHYSKGNNLSAAKNGIQALGINKTAKLVWDNTPFIFSQLSKDYKTGKIAHILPKAGEAAADSSEAKPRDLEKTLRENLPEYADDEKGGKLDKYVVDNKDLSNTKLKAEASFENMQISGFNFSGSTIESSFKNAEIKNSNFENIKINDQAIDSLMSAKSIDKKTIKTIENSIEKQQSSRFNIFSLNRPSQEKLNQFSKFLEHQKSPDKTKDKQTQNSLEKQNSLKSGSKQQVKTTEQGRASHSLQNNSNIKRSHSDGDIPSKNFYQTQEKKKASISKSINDNDKSKGRN